MNKYGLVILAVFCSGLLLHAQSGDLLFQEDAVSGRSGSTSLNPAWAPFYHGVASGDPLEDRVIIWTRVSPEDLNGEPVAVSWRVATDPSLENLVAAGDTSAMAEFDYTVKIDVKGLSPASTYYYGFTALGKNSLTGKTKTTPSAGPVDHLKFGVVSCENFESGYFNACQRLAERTDLDGIIQLGDYIYEQRARRYGDPNLWDEERTIEPEEECITLEDYRTRYSIYRLDSMLARLHQQHPFIPVWDDHEFADNAYKDGALNHTPATEGDWDDRRSAALKTYYEWMPIRLAKPDSSIYRRVSYGDLMDLILLDTRLEGRDMQNYDPFDPMIQESNRTMLGEDQKNWLLDQLETSQARWKVIAQQVPFSPIEFGWAAAIDFDVDTQYGDIQGGSLDAWNGYPAERSQIMSFIETQNLDNVVVLSGSYHNAYAFDVTPQPVTIVFDTVNNEQTPLYSLGPDYDPQTGAGAIGVEFVTPSITSNNFDENLGLSQALIAQQFINQDISIPTFPAIGNPNPHMKYADLIQHGYFVLDVKPERAQADFFFSPRDEIAGPDSEAFDQGWLSSDGANHLLPADTLAPPKAVQDTPAPNDPPSLTHIHEAQYVQAAILGVYPNPFQNRTLLHYALAERTRVRIDLLDSQGQLIRQLLDQTLSAGVYTLETDASDLPAGTYIYRLTLGQSVQEARMVIKK